MRPFVHNLVAHLVGGAPVLLLVGACSIFQGNDTAQSVPVTPVQQAALAPLPPVAPASQARNAGRPGAIPPLPPTQAPLPPQSGQPASLVPSAPAGLPQGAGTPPLPPTPPGGGTAGQVAGISPPSPLPAHAPGSIGGAPPSQLQATSPAFTPQTPRALVGEWLVAEPARSVPCRLSLSVSGVAGVLDAATQGCSSIELSRTAAWQSRGEDIVLLDQRAAPIVLFRPVGANRYEGLGLVGEKFILSR